MYRTTSYQNPNISTNTTMYSSNNNNVGGYYDERGFWVPFVVGGLAGGALGYGIANNNFLSNNGYYPAPRPCCMPRPMPYPMPFQPYY